MTQSHTSARAPQISICSTVKNRSRVKVGTRELKLFPNCVASIARSIPENVPVELVVTDWQSEDWPLQEWLADYAAALPFKHLTIEGTFSRGAGRNAAAAAAAGEFLFFLDADCLISEGLIRQTLDVLNKGHAYFPVLFSYRDPEHQDGWWRHQGYGNCGVTRSVFQQVGGFPEYGFWGREDVQFYELAKSAVDVVREEVPGFYHQWHPDDFEWKNRYGVPSPFEEAKRLEEQEVLLAVREITGLLARDKPVILVDGTLLEDRLRGQLPTLPFIERNGDDWGPPSDSTEAIHEVERMRAGGASAIAFAWPAFWWFDHYGDFHSHLRRKYRCLKDNKRLVIFDLESVHYRALHDQPGRYLQ